MLRSPPVLSSLVSVLIGPRDTWAPLSKPVLAEHDVPGTATVMGAMSVTRLGVQDRRCGGVHTRLHPRKPGHWATQAGWLALSSLVTRSFPPDGPWGRVDQTCVLTGRLHCMAQRPVSLCGLLSMGVPAVTA